MADNDDFYNELVGEARELVNEFGRAYKLGYKNSYNYKQLGSGGQSYLDCIAVQTTWTSNLENDTWANKQVYIISADSEVVEGMYIMDTNENIIALLTKVETVKPADVVVLYIAEFET